ncbi:disease resistance protein RUN1-like isoform X2 [Nicotiana tomentosiformis]|uniref:disease resistance protein RUN1-like isoform X2 n=1 Tax=Nicotiana tomentosiformis TaxID=4098 RepID=UPI0014454437|nr:TMV resistance protein N-like isoform X4 [Nicotiana tomentosiformis]
MDTQLVRGESSHFSYEVFLSFRGEDTRKTFTGHLYSKLSDVGINTFIDDEELRKGDVISRELEKAIEGSRISIVVFSRNYASSSWCLNELVKILECKEILKQMVLPIFYDVDPSQVRKQTGIFGEALAKHKERLFGAQRVEKWRAALTEAANLSGWDLQNVADGHESKFIENIIQQVLQEVNQTPLDVAWHPVGVDYRVKDIEWLLQNECEDEVRMIGIHGVGGIGKTTLAKAIYNRMFRLFHSSCFLSDVRSEAEEFGLVKLQEKLLQQALKNKDIKVGSVAQGINLIKARLESKKVLIVLDDVDHKNQLESLTRERSWFGSGSLIIITTRDKRLLCRLREKERYEAKLLNDNEAMLLFCWHAFDNHFPPEDYVNLARDIIKYSGRLPLALVTLGSHLQGSSVEEWGYEFEKLRAIPHCDIQKILKISFDGLDDETQTVFLDITCAFHGFNEREVTEILNACGFHAKSAIATLVQKHLLQRSWHGLVMHDLVRDMGREIVRMESTRDAGKRSRLFIPQEVRDVLQGNEGSENVEVLKVDPGTLKGVNLSTKAFEQMKNLRVLIINELHISGDFGLLSKKLRWLSWKKCPLKCISSNFPAENLVVLDMEESDIQEFQLNFQGFLEIYLECNEIPEWCRNQVTASSMCLTMPTHNNFLGMVLWVVIDCLEVGLFPSFRISIAHKEPSSIPWSNIGILDGHRELTCVYYISILNEAFYGQMIKGGERIEVGSEDVTVKKIGIHLLYLDQHGKVISLPGDVDHSYYKYPKRVSTSFISSLPGDVEQIFFINQN